MLPLYRENTSLSGSTPILTVGSHDTASAVVGVPAEGDTYAYICCGTWGLVGVELDTPVLTEASRRANFTNELGVDGRVRYLRNVMGLWLLQESMRTWAYGGVASDLPSLIKAAAALPTGGPVIDIDQPEFLPPGDIPARIVDACVREGYAAPTSNAAIVRCILDSLAAAFARTISDASTLSGRRVETVHLVGGGARNELLCQLTADACQLPVLAGPVEATGARQPACASPRCRGDPRKSRCPASASALNTAPAHVCTAATTMNERHTPMRDFTYQDPTKSLVERVADLLTRMTIEEKVGQMLQLDARGDLVDAISVRHAGSILHASPQRLLEAMDLAASTRLAIPLLTADDAIHGHSFWPGATILPTQLAMACTWNPTLIEAGARLTAAEVAATGIHWTFSPVLCIARDIRWGRVGETFGEDPYLIGELGAAMVRGYQGNGLHDPTAVLACAKHFAGYSETQGGRDASEADISRRKLRSWFLPPFERWSDKVVGRSCSATSPWTVSPSSQTPGSSTKSSKESGASPEHSSPTGTTSAAWSTSRESALTSPKPRPLLCAPVTT